MAGHSHWSNIKRKKEKKDKKRAKKFARLSKLISSAVKEGGKDPDMNPTLNTMIEKAKKEDMPKENIEKAIKKGAGEGEEGALEDFILEVYGPDGLAIIVTGETDNRNRTTTEISNLLKEVGGKAAKPGSVSWLFDRKGIIEVEKSEENQLLAIEAGAEDFEKEEEVLKIYTDPELFIEVKKKIAKKTAVESSALGYRPKTESKISEKQEEFIEKLSDHDEVDEIYYTLR